MASRAIVTIGAQERPPTRSVTGTAGPAPSLTPPALRVGKRPQIVEAVGRDQPRRDELPESVLHLARQATGCAHQLWQERCTASLQLSQHGRAGVREGGVGGGSWAPARDAREDPARIVAQPQRHGCHTRWANAATTACSAIRGRFPGRRLIEGRMA